MRILILAAVVALAGCANTDSDHAEAPENQPGRGLAFYSNNDDEYRDASQRAKEWCQETYNAPAKYLNRRDSADGNIVTFGCATN